MISYKAPCKVNASLRVLGKREDGFHEVDTVMIPLELCDELEFSPAPCLGMSCNAPGVPVDESNLVMKAGRLMERELGRPMPWHVHLVKNVPHGAGLGGGSSDAACVLEALNSLEGGGLPPERLAELAGEIGSDVAFSFTAPPAAVRAGGRRWRLCRIGGNGRPCLFCLSRRSVFPRRMPTAAGQVPASFRAFPTGNRRWTAMFWSTTWSGPCLRSTCSWRR